MTTGTFAVQTWHLHYSDHCIPCSLSQLQLCMCAQPHLADTILSTLPTLWLGLAALSLLILACSMAFIWCHLTFVICVSAQLIDMRRASCKDIRTLWGVAITHIAALVAFVTCASTYKYAYSTLRIHIKRIVLFGDPQLSADKTITCPELTCKACHTTDSKCTSVHAYMWN